MGFCSSNKGDKHINKNKIVCMIKNLIFTRWHIVYESKVYSLENLHILKALYFKKLFPSNPNLYQKCEFKKKTTHFGLSASRLSKKIIFFTLCLALIHVVSLLNNVAIWKHHFNIYLFNVFTLTNLSLHYYPEGSKNFLADIIIHKTQWGGHVT